MLEHFFLVFLSCLSLIYKWFSLIIFIFFLNGVKQFNKDTITSAYSPTPTETENAKCKINYMAMKQGA